MNLAWLNFEMLFYDFRRGQNFLEVGAGEGNRTLVSTFPILFLCKTRLSLVNACIIRLNQLH